MCGLTNALDFQVPSWMDLHEFVETKVPALGLVGTPCKIESSAAYCVDDDVQLLCSYFKAYESGEINTLVFEGNHYLYILLCMHMCQFCSHPKFNCITRNLLWQRLRLFLCKVEKVVTHAKKPSLLQGSIKQVARLYIVVVTTLFPGCGNDVTTMQLTRFQG